ncbi:uncharacterized protein BDV14DRAFT_121234 [Aspergillus stella-maris]|uniref:uncharacterized protein n=1 Tax=Aspergillus stella-maris TaxID=1810926 RepID=UPI003CCCC1B8
MSLQTTGLAAVDTEAGLYFYYQEGTEIKEASSEDGVKWQSSTNVVGDKCKVTGSPITVYRAGRDGGSFAGKPTVHVFYIDDQNRLRDKVKVIGGEGEWEEIPVPDDITKDISQYSQLASGTCHVGSHQRVYFEQYLDGGFEISEIYRRTDTDYTWEFTKSLSETRGTALEGTSLAAHFTDKLNLLCLQDHSGQLLKYYGDGEEWKGHEVVLTSEEVEATTPLAMCGPPSSEESHIFYASSGSNIGDLLNGKKTQVGTFWAGTKLAGAQRSETVYLFYRQSVNPYGIATMQFDGKKWKEGNAVVKGGGKAGWSGWLREALGLVK